MRAGVCYMLGSDVKRAGRLDGAGEVDISTASCVLVQRKIGEEGITLMIVQRSDRCAGDGRILKAHLHLSLVDDSSQAVLISGL